MEEPREDSKGLMLPLVIALAVWFVLGAWVAVLYSPVY